MRKYGLYDTTRGLTTAVAAGAAGLLLWTATQVGQQTTARFWAAMGIAAGAGLVLSVVQGIGGWTKGLRLRISPGTLLLGFLPALVCVGWILMANQPGGGWHEGRIVAWSNSLGLMGVVHDVGLWHGVLAFGLGLVLGLALDAVPVVAEVAADRPAIDRGAADEPLAAERDAAQAAEPRTVTVGPRDDTEVTTTHSL
jgi:hypothetical protein